MAMRLQQTELSARASVLAAQRGSLGQRAAQSSEQGVGFNSQVVSTREQLRLIDEEIAALKPVADRGFVSKTRMRALERARAEIIGQSGQFTASVAQTRSATRESEIQVLEAERSYRERTAADMREVNEPRRHPAQVERSARPVGAYEIRAPATGAVVGLTIFTRGGVIAPGEKLMDIVPERTPLLIQTRISPEDADDLVVGQKAMARFSSL